MIRVLASILVLIAAAPIHAAGWQKADGATLSFKGTYQGEAFEGRFERFTPTITFDAGALDASRIDVEVDITSAKTGVADYDSTMQGADFFDSQKFPTARFTTKAIRQVGDGAYEADAELTMRDKTVAIVFPFRFVETGDNARLTSTLTLKRLDFDVGTGDWADASLIANEVNVQVDLPLTKTP